MPLSHRIVRDLFAQRSGATAKAMVGLDWKLVARRVAPPMPRAYESLYQVTCEDRDDIWVGRCRSFSASDPVAWVRVDGKMLEARGSQTVHQGWDATSGDLPPSEVIICRELAIGFVDHPPFLQLVTDWPKRKDREALGTIEGGDIQVRNSALRLGIYQGEEAMSQLIHSWTDTDVRRRVKFRTTAGIHVSHEVAAAMGLALALLAEAFSPAEPPLL